MMGDNNHNENEEVEISDKFVRKGTVIERRGTRKAPSSDTNNKDKGEQQPPEELETLLRELDASLVGYKEKVDNFSDPNHPSVVDQESRLHNLNLTTPRTIPFRSASFSQVDITSDGNYYHVQKSPITLKPSAFCLNNNTIPRSYSRHQQDKEGEGGGVLVTFQFGLHPNPHPQEEKRMEEDGESLDNRGGVKTSNSLDETKSEDISNPISSNNPESESDNNNSEEKGADNSNGESEIGQKDEGDTLSPPPDTDNPPPPPPPTNSPEQPPSSSERRRPSSCYGLNSRTPTEEGDSESNTSEEPPRIVRHDSTKTLKSSSSEEGPSPSEDHPHPPTRHHHHHHHHGGGGGGGGGGSSSSSYSSEKAKLAFKSGLHAKLPLLDLDAASAGGSSSVSGSGGEEEENKTSSRYPYHYQSSSTTLERQSSGHSDGSESQLSDNACSSPPPPPSSSSSNPMASSLLRGTFADKNNSSSSPIVFRSSGGLSSPPPSSSSSPSYYYSRYHYRTPGSPPADLSRTSSVGSSSIPRRYYKRPLRGPYGEMLEAEMNKVWSGRKSLNRELEALDFCRETKSSSPPPPQMSTGDCTCCENSKGIMNNDLRMSSGWSSDHSTSGNNNKHHQHRCRKLGNSGHLGESSSSSSTGGVGVVGVFHQRTASSPSQLLTSSSLSSSSSGNDPGPGPNRSVSSQNQRSRRLDASPRGHVLAELVETEKSYVESLRILVKKYMEPLKACDFIETSLVDEIFFQIPAILWHHERILDSLQRRVIDDTQSVGDVLLEAFRQNSLLECYSLFVNNWRNAKGSLKMAVAAKSQVARFLESNARQHKGKLTIDSLLIMPIQRIPRYELLVKELIKHTEPTHDDHSRLMLALEKIKKFAVHIDCASVDPNDNREIEIEGWSAGLGHLVSSTVVTIVTPSNVRKERMLFLFADSVVIASIKRKTIRKPSSSQSQQSVSSSSTSLEGCKFKLLMKIGLMDVHISNEDRVGDDGRGYGGSPNEDLDDLKTIHKMIDLAALLKCPHVGLDDILRELATGLRQNHCDNNIDGIELEIRNSNENTTTNSSSGDSPEVLKIFFGSVEKKNSWLDSFHDTFGKYIRYGFGRLPPMSFLQALPIRKTRAGLQLSCAAPVWLNHVGGQRVDVWVANSDGYVGQICILTLHPEPAITSCNGVCNSRITCMIAVPPVGFEPPSTPHGYESEDDSRIGRILGRDNKEQWTVWLGTEDGALHVYDCSDSVRVKKSKHKVQHKSPLNCMAYYDGRVFLALSTGDVAIYSRNPQGTAWIISDPAWITLGSGMNPVVRMTPVSNYLWCISGSQVKVYASESSTGTLELVHTLQVNGEHRGVSTLATTDESVWVAQCSSVIKCYSSVTFDILFHLDVSPEVTKILSGNYSGVDEIIRQHKSACLRVTALLVAPDGTLWIGTSAGVILTYTGVNGPNKKLTPLPQGHTGQVRFLTCCSSSRDAWIIISGGDGYEEFKGSGFIVSPNSAFATVTSPTAPSSSMDQTPAPAPFGGVEDSTNHLLIWKVPKPLTGSVSSSTL